MFWKSSPSIIGPWFRAKCEGHCTVRSLLWLFQMDYPSFLTSFSHQSENTKQSRISSTTWVIEANEVLFSTILVSQIWNLVFLWFRLMLTPKFKTGIGYFCTKLSKKANKHLWYDMNITDQAWIKCRSGDHHSQEVKRKIEEIITLT